jgi:hypothetical protein
MSIQGWRLQAISASCIDCRMQSGGGIKKGQKDSSFKAALHHPPSDPARSELLKTIKKRIKSGFYSSETVIDDLGHGFAQALDHTL